MSSTGNYYARAVKEKGSNIESFSSGGNSLWPQKIGPRDDFWSGRVIVMMAKDCRACPFQIVDFNIRDFK